MRNEKNIVERYVMDDQKSKWIQRATAKTNNNNVNKTNKLYSLYYARYVINLFFTQ